MKLFDPLKLHPQLHWRYTPIRYCSCAICLSSRYVQRVAMKRTMSSAPVCPSVPRSTATSLLARDPVPSACESHVVTVRLVFVMNRVLIQQ